MAGGLTHQKPLSSYGIVKDRTRQSGPTNRPSEIGDDGKRRDCCDHCPENDQDCPLTIERCVIHANVICTKCQRCDRFHNSFVIQTSASVIASEGVR
jgi:hypothetical protein